MSTFQSGDWVVYRKPKRSTNPGPRARKIRPTPKGEDYTYIVDKYFVVDETEDNTVAVRTRRGKRVQISRNDPNLRPATWWEKLIHAARFPEQLNARAS
ncbi:MAG: hypothetical protein NXI22_01135 [bacterium]|nr:hypothetical protein [bacterium]